ncbi:MAG: metallophosphoesterase [Kiritimatiellae bacterium]|nr:metallophosphoesterase [Kiritimatiellia bacterium]
MEKKCGRRDFLRGGAAFFVAAGLGNAVFGRVAGPARLRVGILSDIHVVNGPKTCDYNAGSCETFEKALAYFRDQNVDAVVIAGDMADNGLESQLMQLGNAWRKVFPGGLRPDGGRVEKVFVTGNHDLEGWKYGYAKKLGVTKKTHAQDILSLHIAESWKRVFDEDYAPMFIKDVKGYKFVGAHFGEFDKKGAVAAFLKAHEAELAGPKPFFYTQHYHPKATCSAPWVWGQDSGESTAALKAFPNAVAFTGHSHTPLVDDRTLWRGDFTSVGTGSLRYLIPFGGRENSRIFGAKDVGTQQMPYMTCKDGHHGQLMTVYDDRLVLERRDFENDMPAGPDWVVPLPAGASSFEERAKAAPVPQFPVGAEVKLEQIDGHNRKGEAVKQVAVTFPNVRGLDGGARAFDFEVRVEARDVDREKTWTTKRVYSPHYYWAPERDDKTVTCLFALSELPMPNGKLAPERGVAYRFAVSPANSFGRHGAAIRSAFFAAVQHRGVKI